MLGDDWGKWSMLTKFGFVQFAAFVAKSKYYAVWSMSEVSVKVVELTIGRVYPDRCRIQRLRPKDGEDAVESCAQCEHYQHRNGRKLQGRLRQLELQD